MKRILSFVIFFIFALNIANAQNPDGFSISGSTIPCTSSYVEYSVNLPNPVGACTYESFKWTVSNAGGATILNDDEPSCTILWDVDPTEATIKVVVSYPENTCDPVSVTLPVQVGIGSNVSASFPSPVVAGSNTPVTFSATQKRDVSYYWDYAVQPQNNWRYTGEGAEPGFFVKLSDDPDAYKSSVQPGFNSQAVSVRIQRETDCSDFEIFQGFVSVVPPSTLELESSTGSFAIPCVSPSPIIFNIKNLRDGLPLTYRWRLPGGNWNSNNSASKRLTVQPDGVQAGLLEVEVDMVVNGTPYTIRGSQEITVAPYTQTPGIDQDMYFCQGETRSLGGLAVGAIEYY